MTSNNGLRDSEDPLDITSDYGGVQEVAFTGRKLINR